MASLQSHPKLIRTSFQVLRPSMPTLLLILIFTTSLLLEKSPEAAAESVYSPRGPGVQGVAGVQGSGVGRCERITMPLCTSMKYNLTMMPNLVGHSSQKEAELRINEFIPLIQLGCSRLLTFFLCSLYAPMCTEQVDETLLIPPCRSMCLDVKSRCERVLLSFNFHWPQVLDCSRLPERSDRNHLCIDASGGDGEEDGLVGGPWGTGGLPRERDGKIIPGGIADNAELAKLMESLPKDGQPGSSLGHFGIDAKEIGRYVNELGRHANEPGRYAKEPGSQSGSSSYQSKENNGCPPRFVRVGRRDFKYGGSGNSNMTSCAPRCMAEVMFTEQDKRFSEIWMLVWSSVSLLSTSVTLLTFLLDTTRFPYPERPVVFIAFCCLLYTLGYFIRAGVGRERVSCDTTPSRDLFTIQEGLESSWCIVVFLFLYFFGMAASIWWAVLTLTFYLAAGRKWGHEAVERLSSWFHVAAWAGPALLTISVLTLRRVDGDELYGICYVGNQDPTGLTVFVIVPLSVCLFVGVVFLLAGFISMLSIRRNLRVGSAVPAVAEPLMYDVSAAQRPASRTAATRPSTMGSSGVYYTTPGGASSIYPSNTIVTLNQNGQHMCINTNSANPSPITFNTFNNMSLDASLDTEREDYCENGASLSYIKCCCCRTNKRQIESSSGNTAANKSSTNPSNKGIKGYSKNSITANKFNNSAATTANISTTTVLDIRRFERLMLKLGLFALLYAVPAACVLGCFIHERLGMDEWRQEAMTLPCFNELVNPPPGYGRGWETQGSGGSGKGCGLDRSIPSVELFSLKIFMLLAVGATCGVWIWSGKTLRMWRKFFNTILPCSGAYRKPASTPGYSAKNTNNNSSTSRVFPPSTTRFPPLPPPPAPSSLGVSIHNGNAVYTPVTSPHLHRLWK